MIELKYNFDTEQELEDFVKEMSNRHKWKFILEDLYQKCREKTKYNVNPTETTDDEVWEQVKCFLSEKLKEYNVDLYE